MASPSAQILAPSLYLLPETYHRFFAIFVPCLLISFLFFVFKSNQRAAHKQQKEKFKEKNRKHDSAISGHILSFFKDLSILILFFSFFFPFASWVAIYLHKLLFLVLLIFHYWLCALQKLYVHKQVQTTKTKKNLLN